jgi:lysozyme family protein
MANFLSYLPLLQAVEGGYTNNPSDPGNWTGGKIGVGDLVGTNKGISAPVYGEYIGRKPTVADMKSITNSTAKIIFRVRYWDLMKGDQIINQSVANILIDHAINAGRVRASRMVQEILNKKFSKRLVVDGVIGNMTVAAINSVDQQKLFDEIKKERTAYYNSLGGTFLAGWLNRLKSFAFEIKKKEVAIGGSILLLALVAFAIYQFKK